MKMKIKRLKELIIGVPDDVEVYFMFGINDKYKNKKNEIFTLKEELKKEAEVYAEDKKPFDGQAQLYIIDGFLAGAEPREKKIEELEEEIQYLTMGKISLQSLGWPEAIQLFAKKDKRIAELEAQVEKMKNQKVFLLQKVDSSDNSIDKQFYTTDEEFAKEWDDYHKCNHGKAIELEEF